MPCYRHSCPKDSVASAASALVSPSSRRHQRKPGMTNQPKTIARPGELPRQQMKGNDPNQKTNSRLNNKDSAEPGKARTAGEHSLADKKQAVADHQKNDLRHVLSTPPNSL